MKLPRIFLVIGLLSAMGLDSIAASPESLNVVRIQRLPSVEKADRPPWINHNTNLSILNRSHTDPRIISGSNLQDQALSPMPATVLSNLSITNTSQKPAAKNTQLAQWRYYTLLAGAAINMGLISLALFLQRRFPTPRQAAALVIPHQAPKRKRPPDRQRKPAALIRRRK